MWDEIIKQQEREKKLLSLEIIKVTYRKTERRIEERKKKTERRRQLFLYCPCSTFLQIPKILQFIFYTKVCISNNDNLSMSLKF